MVVTGIQTREATCVEAAVKHKRKALHRATSRIIIVKCSSMNQLNMLIIALGITVEKKCLLSILLNHRFHV